MSAEVHDNGHEHEHHHKDTFIKYILVLITRFENTLLPVL
jgi:hypothetical protein